MNTNIVVFGGTAEGRLLAEAFQNTDLILHLSVATEYGASLLPKCSNIKVSFGRMDKKQMKDFLFASKAAYCLDATHPYATEVTRNIYEACHDMSVSYIRVLRKEGELFADSKQKTLPEETGRVHMTASVKEAVEYLEHTTGTIFLTTGSKELEAFTYLSDYQDRCVARVLPTVAVLEKCKELGFEGKNLIAMQGPFSEELNYQMFRQTNTAFVVTKNSGAAGGYQEKCEAALRAGADIVVIEREQELIESGIQTEVYSLEEAITFLREAYHIADRQKIYLVGMGTGGRQQLTREAEEAIQASDILIGAKRMLDICRKIADKPMYASYQKEAIVEYIKEHQEYRTIALVYSGDIGFYSGAYGMQDWLKEFDVHPISGISSVLYFLNRLGIPWADTRLVSCHGQEISLLSEIISEKRVCALLGAKDSVKRISKKLLAFGMDQVKITVGERLSYPEERIFSGTAKDFLEEEVDTLAVALFENPKTDKYRQSIGISDESFVRGKVPMTKEEIRTISLAKLCLTEDAVVYDVGAGSGSVSVEAARFCRNGKVYAIERKDEAVSLIRENQTKFRVENLEVVYGEALDCIRDLPSPTHVFIGGSGGNLLEIIRMIRQKNSKVRFVINAVTLETVAELAKIREAFPEYDTMEIVQIAVSKGRELGAYHLMTAQNPVWIASFGGNEND